MKVKSESEVAQLCLTFSDAMDCSPPGSPSMDYSGKSTGVGCHRLLHGTRLVIAFLPRGRHLLISWLKSPSAVILEPKKIKSVNVSFVSPSICREVMGPMP